MFESFFSPPEALEYTKISLSVGVQMLSEQNAPNTIIALFNVFLERIMTDAIEDLEGTVSFGG